MSTDFSVLSQFLDSLSPEVSGRSSSPLSEDEIRQIRRFAAGELDESERNRLLPGILANEKALHELVEALASRNR